MDSNTCTFTENKLQYTLVLNDNVLFIETVNTVNYAIWTATIEEREKEVSLSDGPVRFITNYSPINIFNIIRDHVNGSLESKDIKVIFANMKNTETDISIEIITHAPYDNKIKDSTFILIHPKKIDFEEKVTKNMENQKSSINGRIDELFTKHEIVSQNIIDVNAKIDNLDKRLTQFMEEINEKLNNFVTRTKISEVNVRIDANEKKTIDATTDVNKKVDANYKVICDALNAVDKKVDATYKVMCDAVNAVDKKVDNSGIIKLQNEISSFKAEITKLKSESRSYPSPLSNYSSFSKYLTETSNKG